jgi:lipopolysaccharide export LptBFGC system permease protein LptF
MHTRLSLWIGVVVILFFVIIGLTIALFAIPGPTASNTATTTPGTATGNTQPLSERVTVTTPQPNATVEKVFIIAGSAPGPWFFEASFPIKVIDQNGNVILNTYAEAQGDWMTTDLVTFVATATTTGYAGPATLVLLRDNPSGLPENDDSIEIPIIIQ